MSLEAEPIHLRKEKSLQTEVSLQGFFFIMEGAVKEFIRINISLNTD